MRVTSIDLYSDRFEENLRFSLQHASPFDKYMIRQIVGLDAEELIPKFSGFGRQFTKPRKKFFDFTMPPREVAMRVALNPNFANNESYSDVRDELYKMVSATLTGEVIIYFNAGATAVAQLNGFITKFENAYFNALPETQITIRCEDPMMRGVAPIIYDVDDDAYPDPIIVDGFLQAPDTLSTAPHGFAFNGIYTAAGSGSVEGSSQFRLRDTAVRADCEWEFVFSGGTGFLTGDTLSFSSEIGEKELSGVLAGTPLSLVDRITTLSTWPTLFPGQNSIFFGHHDVFQIKHVEYYPAYWGV
jgi:hypothetical protein